MMMKRREILDTAAELIDGQRAKDYGNATESFTRIGKMWSQILHLDYDISPAHVALMMNALKISRLSETISHEDSWVDAAGYIALGGEAALNPANAKEPTYGSIAVNRSALEGAVGKSAFSSGHLNVHKSGVVVGE